MTTAEADARLVHCGCGVVRNDEDPLFLMALESRRFGTAQAAGAGQREPINMHDYEQPRVCRGCGCVYMLPKPQAPTVPK